MRTFSSLSTICVIALLNFGCQGTSASLLSEDESDTTEDEYSYDNESDLTENKEDSNDLTAEVDGGKIYWVDAEKWIGLFDRYWDAKKRFKGSRTDAWKECQSYLNKEMSDVALEWKRCVYR